MDSLRQAGDNATLIKRIEALQEGTRPEWGKMTAPEMLAHCQRPLEVAVGELQLKRGLIGFLFGRMAKKKFVVGDAPFGRNSPTDPKFLTPGADDFAREQGSLIELVKRFGATGAATDEHPFFGSMNPEEWDRLMWKHLDHHLRQFGV